MVVKKTGKKQKVKTKMPKLDLFIRGDDTEEIEVDDIQVESRSKAVSRCQVTGRKGKELMSLLNQKKVNKYEMDDLFMD
jgi:SUMO ligase MMS21 Smc5/6 complex component